MTETRFRQKHTAFSMTCRVTLSIHADPERVWRLLTDAKDFPRRNSTVTSIEGQIREGERLRLRVPGTDRMFTPKVSDVVPNQHMNIGGLAPLFRGVRRFGLMRREEGSTDFAMEERFSGLMLPLIRRSPPDFGPISERYANDLKDAAERTASA